MLRVLIVYPPTLPPKKCVGRTRTVGRLPGTPLRREGSTCCKTQLVATNVGRDRRTPLRTLDGPSILHPVSYSVGRPSMTPLRSRVDLGWKLNNPKRWTLDSSSEPPYAPSAQ